MALALIFLHSVAEGCDWTTSPWMAFDGRMSKVLDAADGAPTAWLLNGSCRVARDDVWVTRGSALACLDQSLTFESCETTLCAEEARPHALVEIGGHSTAVGGTTAGRTTWRLLGANDSAAGRTRRRVYAFGTLALAVVEWWVEEVGDAQWRVRKRMRVQPTRTSVVRAWTHVAVNVASC
jgi:hypothetical protein